MTSAELLGQVIAEPETRAYEWVAILGCFWDFSRRRLTNEEKDLLRRATEFHGHVLLTHMYDGPHRCAPDQMIREAAKSLLEDPARW